MKRSIAIVLSILMLAFMLTGCAKAKDAAMDTAELATGAMQDAASDAVGSAPSVASGDTASEFYTAYVEEKSSLVTNLMNGLGNNPDTTMSAFSFLGATFSDLYLLPASYFGLGEDTVKSALAMLGNADVRYQEDGNNYSVAYRSAEGKTVELKGTYDAGKSLRFVGSTDGKENVFSEVYKTSSGYLSQFYSIDEDGTGTLYLFSVQGKNGSIGISTGGERPGALTGSEGADFTHAAKEWYAYQDNLVTGVTAEGKSVQFEYVPESSNG